MAEPFDLLKYYMVQLSVVGGTVSLEVSFVTSYSTVEIIKVYHPKTSIIIIYSKTSGQDRLGIAKYKISHKPFYKVDMKFKKFLI